jgi:hypothetical protein
VHIPIKITFDEKVLKNQRLFSLPKNQERRLCPMKTYQVEIKETLSMTIESEAENAQQAEEIIREAYVNQEYILDAEHFTGVDFSTREKEIDTRSRDQKHHGQER